MDDDLEFIRRKWPRLTWTRDRESNVIEGTSKAWTASVFYLAGTWHARLAHKTRIIVCGDIRADSIEGALGQAFERGRKACR